MPWKAVDNRSGTAFLNGLTLPSKIVFCQSRRSYLAGKEPMAISTGRDTFIVCRNSQGTEFRATLLRLTRYTVVFEVYNPYSILQLSEVLTDFRIIMNDRM